MNRKYIDADTLRIKITDLCANANFYQQKAIEESNREDFVSFGGEISAYAKVLVIIDSLQQEQPEIDLEKETEKYFKGWTETDDGIACHYQYVDLNTCRSIAHHFYELGSLNTREEE